MPKARKLLSLDPDVVELLDATENASGRVEELVRLAASGHLVVELSPAEAKELALAAAESGVTPAQYARLLVAHAVGHVGLSERLERASEAGSAVFWGAVAKLGEGKAEGKAGGAKAAKRPKARSRKAV